MEMNLEIDLEIPTELIDNASQEIDYRNLRGKIVVGLAGFSRSGKDTIAKTLIKRLGFKRISFADTLKEDLNEFLKDQVYYDLISNDSPLDMELINFLHPSTQEVKEILRPYMIWFGEKMKQINGPHHWTNRAFSKIEPDDRKLVISDVRRINELEIFRNSKEFQKIRNKNREELGINIPSYYEVDAEYDSLLFFVNQIHNKDDDSLTKQTIMKAIEEWLFTDTIYIDSRIQDITNYHEKHVVIQVKKLVEKYPEYFI